MLTLSINATKNHNDNIDFQYFEGKEVPLASCEWNPVLANLMLQNTIISCHSMKWWKPSGGILRKLHE
jgi:hypothetical protein